MGSSFLSKTGRQIGKFHKYKIKMTCLKFHNAFVMPPGYWLIFKGQKKLIYIDVKLKNLGITP